MDGETRAGASGLRLVGRRTAARLIFFLAALEGLVFGYDTGVVAGALLFIRQDLGLTPALEGLVVGALLLGSLIAAPVAGWLSGRVGARRLIGAAGLLFVIGSLGAALAPDATVLILFRFVLGIAVGIGSVQVPVYLAELSPAATRGRLTSLYQLMTATGIFLAYVVGYLFAATGDWRTMFGVAVVPAVLLTAGVLVLPESPRWLARRRRFAEAQAALEATRPPAEGARDLDEIRTLATAPVRLRDLLRDRWTRRVLVIVLALAAFQQVLGINTIVYYSPTILQTAGFSAGAAIFAGGALQALSIVSTFVLGRVVDRAGRRVLLMAGALVMAASMASLGAIFATGALGAGGGAGAAVACLAVFKAAFSASWGPIVWIVLPELLPLHGRGAAMGACVFTVYAANFIISTLFPILLASGPAVTFGAFAAMGVLAFLFVAAMLPETARRTLEEIERAGKGALGARS